MWLPHRIRIHLRWSPKNLYFKFELVFCVNNVCCFTLKIKINKSESAYVSMRAVHLFVLMWVRVFNVEEYYTQRKRCQLTRCRVDQHSSKVRSLMAAALFDRDNCSFFCCTQNVCDRYCYDIVAILLIEDWLNCVEQMFVSLQSTDMKSKNWTVRFISIDS